MRKPDATDTPDLAPIRAPRTRPTTRVRRARRTGHRAGDRPRHLTTRQFYEAIRDRLAPGGAMALNIEPHSQALGDALLTTEAVFGHHETYGDGSNVVLITRRGPALDAATLEARARALDARFSPRHGLRELLAARQPLTPAPGARIRTDA